MVRQGCSLPSVIFSICVEVTIKPKEKIKKVITILNITIVQGEIVNILLFADDMAIHTESGEDVEGLLQ